MAVRAADEMGDEEENSEGKERNLPFFFPFNCRQTS